MISALDSEYIIDGVHKDLTPSQLLGGGSAKSGLEPIIDESVDPDPCVMDADESRVDEYLNAALSARQHIQLPFAGTLGRAAVARSLIDAIWRQGNFRLGNLSLEARWHWSASEIGAMASFYDSVEQVSDYADALGVGISAYSCEEGEPSLEIDAVLSSTDEEDLLDQPFGRVENPSMGKATKHPQTLVPDPHSWIVFIPFESSDFRLGGSVLAQELGLVGGRAPKIEDPDYFMDCFEVVRELVEDGIILSGATCGLGGMLTALKRMASDGCGAEVDLTDLRRAYPKCDMLHLLFAEVPGVLIQIRDIDFDYLDAELLLQDVAFFPLGHPVPDSDSVRVKASARTGIENILQSLLSSQAEGED